MTFRLPILRALLALSTLTACDSDRLPQPSARTDSEPGPSHSVSPLRAPSSSAIPPPLGATTLDGDRLLSELEQGRGVAGWPAIIQRLQTLTTTKKRHYLLVGHHHDSGGQLAAFTRLVGPRGLGIPTLALEHFDTNTQFAPYLERKSDGQQLRALIESRYTAWKYGYTERLWGLLDMARAHGVKVVGCDMPPPQVPAERDAHCGKAAAKLQSRRVALFYGAAHLEPKRLPSHLQGGVVTRVMLHGWRPRGVGIEARLRFRLTDPLMVELDGVHVLLLDGPVLGAKVDRVRLKSAPPGLTIRGPGRLILAGLSTPLNGPSPIPLRPGVFVYRAPDPSTAVIGGVSAQTATLDFVEPGVVRIEARALSAP